MSHARKHLKHGQACSGQQVMGEAEMGEASTKTSGGHLPNSTKSNMTMIGIRRTSWQRRWTTEQRGLEGSWIMEKCLQQQPPSPGRWRLAPILIETFSVVGLINEAALYRKQTDQHKALCLRGREKAFHHIHDGYLLREPCRQRSTQLLR